MSSSTEKTSQRCYSIDSLKFLAAVSVVYLHVYANPMAKNYGESWTVVYSVIKQTARWAVPLFFAVSGYLFTKSLQKAEDRSAVLKKYLKRILSIWIIWSFFYILWPREFLPTVMEFGIIKTCGWHVLQIPAYVKKHAVELLLFGGHYHLWYLLAAAFGIFYCYYVPKYVRWPLALALYAVCAVQTYMGEVYEVHKIGICFAPVFMLTGAALAERPLRSLRDGVMLIVLGVAVMAAEILFFGLRRGFDSFLVSLYLYGLIPLVAGLLTIALNRPEWGKNTIGQAGVYALGIYLLHPVILDNAVLLIKSPWVYLALPLMVFGLTWMLVKAMSFYPKLRELVT